MNEIIEIDESKIPKETKEKMKTDKYYYDMIKFQWQYCLETFYKDIIEHTMQTVFISLSYDDAMKINQCCKQYYENEIVVYDNGIVKRIDDALMMFDNGRCFVKLSLRSPKDVFFYNINDKLNKLLDEELKKSSGSENDDCIAFVRAYRKVYMVRNGKEAFEMLVKSKRIKEDMLLYTKFPQAFKMNIVLREWEDIDPSMEFRGFVYKKNLTALSQYNDIEYFEEELVKRKDYIEKKIRSFFKESIVDKIQHENYIIDFAIVDDDEKVIVIEINPFFNKTGASMFQWGRDQKIIKGELPFEFRIREEPLPHPLQHAVSFPYQKYIKDFRGITNKPKTIKPNINKRKCIIL